MGDQIDRIIVRGANWIGDAVMTLPALERLRASFPRSHVALLATPLTAGLFDSSPFVDEVVEYRRREEGVSAFWGAVRLMRARRFDLAALFQNAFEAALLAALGGARVRIGFAAQGRGPLLTHRLRRVPQSGGQPLTHKLGRVPQSGGRHQIHDYLDVVAECERVCLGVNPESRISNLESQVSTPLPSLTASPAQRQAAESLLRRAGAGSNSRPLVALNAGATNSRAKRWPEDRFAALADRLIESLGSRIVFIGAASERDCAERIIRRMKRRGAVNLAGETGMAELIGALDACDLLISNDTGPAHVAAALGRPTLTIFGPTNEFETAPQGPRAAVIRAEGVECARCMLRDCPIDHRCMTRVSPADVFERALELL